MDITRLVRRAGRAFTGVDRVEIAYLDALVADPVPAFGMLRTPFGYVLLDNDGLEGLGALLRDPEAMGAPDFMSRLPRGLHRAARQAQSEARRRKIARCLPQSLAKMLRRHLPDGTNYINVGHSNLTDRVLRAARGMGGQVAIMIHDVIPLDFPQYQRVGTVDVFREKLKRTRAYADVILYNSADTQRRAVAHMEAWGPVPLGIVSHLGTNAPEPSRDFQQPKAPYFVTIGTIEPRKNHSFLLDIWDEMGPSAPHLHIVGARGWNNEAVFARLDAAPQDGPVIEHSSLNDGDMAALLNGAAGLLFPTFAEGFGLPPVEAAALGVPVVCNDLDTIREVLGNIPIYASVRDRYLWTTTINQLAGAAPDQSKFDRFSPPGWPEHFNTVLRLI